LTQRKCSNPLSAANPLTAAIWHPITAATSPTTARAPRFARKKVANIISIFASKLGLPGN
jgi:hypothetical protein